MAITDPTLDPVTGIPLDASYATQYQVPLGSQPINLDELNAQGKQGNWLYPDNLPPVVARLQARDLTNPGNAQDLSTDGKRNLNVNIAENSAGGGGGTSTWDYSTGRQENGFFAHNIGQWDTISPSPSKIYSFTGHAFADAVDTTGGGTFGRYVIGFGQYTSSLDFPLFSGMFSFDPTYPNYIYANLTWSLLWPDGLPIPANIISADNFTIWVDGGGFRGQMTYTMLYK